MPEFCAHCGDPIPADVERVEVVRRSPGGMNNREVIARFHGDPLPCFTEARDYGWE